jgi:hypothetical protein
MAFLQGRAYESLRFWVASTVALIYVILFCNSNLQALLLAFHVAIATFAVARPSFHKTIVSGIGIFGILSLFDAAWSHGRLQNDSQYLAQYDYVGPMRIVDVNATYFYFNGYQMMPTADTYTINIGEDVDKYKAAGYFYISWGGSWGCPNHEQRMCRDSYYPGLDDEECTYPKSESNQNEVLYRNKTFYHEISLACMQEKYALALALAKNESATFQASFVKPDDDNSHWPSTWAIGDCDTCTVMKFDLEVFWDVDIESHKVRLKFLAGIILTGLFIISQSIM